MTGVMRGDRVRVVVEADVVAVDSHRVWLETYNDPYELQIPFNKISSLQKITPPFVVGGEVTAAMGEPPVGSVIRHYDGTYLHTAVGWVDTHGRNVTVEHQMDGYEGPIWGTFMVGGEVKETTLLWLGGDEDA